MYRTSVLLSVLLLTACDLTQDQVRADSATTSTREELYRVTETGGTKAVATHTQIAWDVSKFIKDNQGLLLTLLGLGGGGSVLLAHAAGKKKATRQHKESKAAQLDMLTETLLKKLHA